MGRFNTMVWKSSSSLWGEHHYLITSVEPSVLLNCNPLILFLKKSVWPSTLLRATGPLRSTRKALTAHRAPTSYSCICAGSQAMLLPRPTPPLPLENLEFSLGDGTRFHLVIIRKQHQRPKGWKESGFYHLDSSVHLGEVWNRRWYYQCFSGKLVSVHTLLLLHPQASSCSYLSHLCPQDLLRFIPSAFHPKTPRCSCQTTS